MKKNSFRSLDANVFRRKFMKPKTNYNCRNKNKILIKRRKKPFTKLWAFS